MVRVCFENITERGVLIAKISRGGRVLKEIGEREGVLGEIALLLPPSRVQNRGGGGERRRRPIRAPWAEAAAGTEGEREREPWWIDPRPHLER